MLTLLRKSIFILFLLFFTLNAYSQFSAAYYSSGTPKLGIGYNINERLRTELRLYTNMAYEDATPELVFCYNLVNKEHYSIYAGIGGVVNYFNGAVLPVGVQFFPIEKFKSFSLHIEAQPMILSESVSFMQASWGLRIKF